MQRLILTGRGWCVAVWFVLAPAFAIAQPAESTISAFDASRSKSAASSWKFAGMLTIDALADVAGGIRQGDRLLDKVVISAAYDGADGDKNGLTGLMSIQYVNGARFSRDLVGDIQTASNIDAIGGTRLYEAWLAQGFDRGQAGLKFGLIDLNSEFDTQETAAIFLNSAHGIGPDFSQSGFNGPSIFPTTALAATAFISPDDGWTLRAGIFDGMAGDPAHPSSFVTIKLSPQNGALLVTQLEKRWGNGWRIESGIWNYTAPFPALDQFESSGAARQSHGDFGLYGLIEGRLYTDATSDKKGLDGWIRYGMANSDINQIGSYRGAGLVYTGLVSGRDDDQAGIAIAQASFGEPARIAAQKMGFVLRGAETTVEATYHMAFGDWLTLQPDVQYVMHPGGNAIRGNATVLGARITLRR